jgi:hypothetical protein
MRVPGSTIEAVGPITFRWGDFNMTAPSAGSFVSGSDGATMELDRCPRRA